MEAAKKGGGDEWQDAGHRNSSKSKGSIQHQRPSCRSSLTHETWGYSPTGDPASDGRLSHVTVPPPTVTLAHARSSEAHVLDDRYMVSVVLSVAYALKPGTVKEGVKEGVFTVSREGKSHRVRHRVVSAYRS